MKEGQNTSNVIEKQGRDTMKNVTRMDESAGLRDSPPDRKTRCAAGIRPAKSRSMRGRHLNSPGLTRAPRLDPLPARSAAPFSPPSTRCISHKSEGVRTFLFLQFFRWKICLSKASPLSSSKKCHRATRYVQGSCTKHDRKKDNQSFLHGKSQIYSGTVRIGTVGIGTESGRKLNH